MTTLTIGNRFNGPPNSGNGGWTAGALASFVGGPAVVTLRKPPPLETELTVTSKDSIVSVYAPDGSLVADAAPATVALEPIGALPFDDAVAISAGYPGFASHPFPGCFVCGPAREPGDGLRLFTGRVADGLTATPWTVPADVSAPMTWASLDCPGGWSVGLEARPYVLGRIAGHVAAVPEPGTNCVVMGRLLANEGRKAQVATVLYAADGTALAWSHATWIAIG